MRVTVSDQKIDAIIKHLGPVLARGGLQTNVDVRNLTPNQKQELARFVIDDILGDYVYLLQAQMMRSGATGADLFTPEQVEQMVDVLRQGRMQGQINNKRGLGKYLADEPVEDESEFDSTSSTVDDFDRPIRY